MPESHASSFILVKHRSTHTALKPVSEELFALGIGTGGPTADLGLFAGVGMGELSVAVAPAQRPPQRALGQCQPSPAICKGQGQPHRELLSILWSFSLGQSLNQSHKHLSPLVLPWLVVSL